MRRVCLALLVASLLTPRLWAQASASSALTGVITDKSGAVVPEAQLTLTSQATGLVRTAVSSSSGVYRFDLLPAGTYTLKVTKPGFATATVTGIELIVSQTTTVNVTLSPGPVSETVTVTSEAPLIEATKSDVGLEITPGVVSDLPLNGRDFANLAYLAPGARPVDSYDPTKNRFAVFAINGSSGRNVMVTVNGVDNKDNTVGGPVMQLPLTAIQEFNISTQRFSAANGRSEGGVVNVITKSGTNDFHGSLYFYDTETALNANDHFSEQAHQPTPDFSRQQFGGSIGGPIRRDRDFFFFAIERQREHTQIPVTQDAYQELSLVKSLGAVPATAIPTPYFDWRYSARLDHRFNDAHSASLTYNAQTNRDLNDQSGNTNDLTAGNFTTNKMILASLNVNSVLSPRVVNAFTLGYQYWNNLISTDHFSQMTVFFPGGIYFGTNTNVPQQSLQKKWQFKDDLSITHNNHTFRTGVDYVWEPVLGGFFEFNPVLSLTFLDKPSVILSNTTKYPQGFQTPGAVVAMSATAGDPRFDLPGGAKMFGVYFQDDWKVLPSFTLNLGLRWDKDFNLFGNSAAQTNRTYLELKAIGSPYARKLPEDDNRGWGPRFGFAWDIHGNGRHILRGGYGLYFGQTFLNIPLFMIQQANPTLFTTVLSLSSSGPGDPNADFVPGTGLRLSQWRFGIDPLPTIPPPPTQLGNGFTGRLMDPDYRNPYSQQWNIGYAFQWSQVSVLEVDYIHEIGLHEAARQNINPKLLSLGGDRPLTQAFQQAGLPVLGPIVVEQSVNRSRYDGLNVSYRRRMSRHFSINTAYVLSRGVSYQCAAATFGCTATDPFNRFTKTDFGPVPSDERHRWTFSGVFDLPAGFQLAPIIQAASARPYNTVEGIDVFGYGARVSQAHAIVLTSQPNNLTATAGWTAAQLRSCLAAGQCRELSYNALRGQPFFQMDLRVAKNFRFSDRYNLRLIFQSFDLTNRANFGNNYDGNIRSSTFGQPIGYITPSGVIVPKSFRAEFGAEFSF